MVGRVLVPCADLHDMLAFCTETLGLRVDRISPADDPREVDLTGGGLSLRLVSEPQSSGAGIGLELDATLELRPGTLVAPNGMTVRVVERTRRRELPPLVEELVVTRADASGGFGTGRAGMGYRDLIPSRLGGRFIASHIRIEDGGPVPDYVHFHRIRFQLIYCRRGWVEVVYEDQGPPFVMEPGDCVIQPPEIRHRVLASSPGLEVVEVGCPAEHDTFADHDLELPTGRHLPERDYQGQRFVRHVAKDAPWVPGRLPGWQSCPVGVEAATDGLAEIRTLRPEPGGSAHNTSPMWTHRGELAFFFVLDGTSDLDLGDRIEPLAEGDSVTVPSGLAHRWLRPSDDCRLLEVTLPADAAWSAS